jgi:protein-tyrosine phosphatase
LVNSREEGARTYNRQIDVLLLCTANQCRSPMAEVLLRRRLAAAGEDVAVRSAGLHPSGAPATAEAIDVMARRGLLLEGHRSHQVTPEDIGAADLVIGMAREHVREAAVIDSDAFTRTFTLKELVAAGRVHGGRAPGEPLDDWLARISVGRRRQSLLGASYDEVFDVADPVGHPIEDYEVTAHELEALLDELVGLVWPVEIGTVAGPTGGGGRA